jgi:serine/threonine protein kinase
VLGRGVFAKVMLVKYKQSGDLYAIKIMHKEKINQSQQK